MFGKEQYRPRVYKKGRKGGINRGKERKEEKMGKDKKNAERKGNEKKKIKEGKKGAI